MKELELPKVNSQIPMNGIPANGNGELFQKRWFCVSLDPSGATHKEDAESPAPLLDIINSSVVSWVDYITDDPLKDLPIIAAQMGFSEQFISSISADTPLKYQDFDTEMWMRMPSIQIRGVDVKTYPLFFLIRDKIVFTIHVSLVDKRFIRLRRYSDTILKKIPVDGKTEDALTALMIRIIDANDDSNFRHLRVIEEAGDDLNQALMQTSYDRTSIPPKIYDLKHALITYMNGLWDSVDVLHTLRYGDAELITNDDRMLEIISVMADEVRSQIGLAEHMSEVLASGLEVMQTIYNNQLQTINNRFALVMTYLTIVGTAVLVPNTLATLMGSTAFNLQREDLWWYILLLVAATVIATLGVWWWLRRRGWLPKDKEN
jgi:magnesium transporter